MRAGVRCRMIRSASGGSAEGCEEPGGTAGTFGSLMGHHHPWPGSPIVGIRERCLQRLSATGMRNSPSGHRPTADWHRRTTDYTGDLDEERYLFPFLYPCYLCSPWLFSVALPVQLTRWRRVAW